MPTLLFPGEIAESAPWKWQDDARKQNIPDEYWPTADLPPFCALSEGDWWKFIWSRLDDKKKELLPRLEKSGRLRDKAKSRRWTLRDFHKQFRKHWLALVKLREAGIF